MYILYSVILFIIKSIQLASSILLSTKSDYTFRKVIAKFHQFHSIDIESIGVQPKVLLRDIVPVFMAGFNSSLTASLDSTEKYDHYSSVIFVTELIEFVIINELCMPVKIQRYLSNI